MTRIFTALVLLLALTGSLRGQQEERFSFDIDHRSRLVYWDEGLFPVDGWEALFSRHRSIAGVTWTPLDALQLRVALANEFFSWYRHPNKPDFTFNEVFFENLYLRWSPESLPLTLTIGRQNLIFDEGFVMMDGGPLDGSRAIYFNAVRGDVTFAPGHSVTAFALHQPVQDNLLPLLNDADRDLLEAPTDAAGLYYTGAAHDGGEASAYYLFTREDEEELAGTVFITPITRRHTVGVRYSRVLGTDWRVTAEGNLQRGAHHYRGLGEIGLRAWSWYAYATWRPGERVDLSLDAGMYQYSGGRYDAGEGLQGDQRYVPVLARWPKWSESFIYTLVGLRGSVATWSNLIAPFLRVTWRAAEPVTLFAMLQHIRESHASGGEGKEIGTLGILETKVDAGRGLTGHVLLERMWLRPDGATVTADRYTWARLELRYRLRI